MGKILGFLMMLVGAVLAVFNSIMIQQHPDDTVGYVIWVWIGLGLLVAGLATAFVSFHKTP